MIDKNAEGRFSCVDGRNARESSLRVTVFAYAKINLTLNVIGKRPDGFHDIESIMQAVSLRDDVTVLLQPAGCDGNSLRARSRSSGERRTGEWRTGERIRVNISTKDEYIAKQSIPTGMLNTAYKAADEFFARQAPGNLSVDIHINKRIPAAAGLAGGSADAAAVLLALNYIANRARESGVRDIKPLSDNELLETASRVGSDVPFCLLFGTQRAESETSASATTTTAAAVAATTVVTASTATVTADLCRKKPAPIVNGTAYAQGFGERLNRLLCPPPKFSVVLANPRIEISTKQVFNDFMPLSAETIGDLSKLTQAMIESQCDAWKHCFNALERGVADIYPQIAIIKAALLNAGALSATMSGSGPTVYGLFDNYRRAIEAADAIGGNRTICKNGCWTVVCHFV